MSWSSRELPRRARLTWRRTGLLVALVGFGGGARIGGAQAVPPPASRAAVSAVGLFALPAQSSLSTQTVPGPAPFPGRPAAAVSAPRRLFPSWFETHGEQRTRFESLAHRYRPGEVGGDDIMAFRTRLQARVTSSHVLAIAEAQDARVALTDSASTVTNRMVSNTKFSQLSAGLRWRDLLPSRIAVQVEVGRFSREYGNGRLIARPPFGNVSNGQDGILAGVRGKTWIVQALGGRPVIYTYPALTFDDRFRDARFGGVYATSTRWSHANADVYLLHLGDGSRFPAATRRRIETGGVRLFGTFGALKQLDYESETAVQWGGVGPLRHRAGLEHAQVGHSWPRVPLKPRVVAIYDYASGDADPTDQRSGTFDTLYGRTRFELGPTGIFGVLGRSNLQSPGVWLITTPIRPVEVSVQHRWAWLAQARDRWRPIGIGDPTGASGNELGRQTDMRLRYRWRQHLEFDAAAVRFTEGDFVRARRPTPDGHTTFYVASTEWRF